MKWKLLVLVVLFCFFVQGFSKEIKKNEVKKNSDTNVTSKKVYVSSESLGFSIEIPLKPGTERDLAVKEMLYRFGIARYQHIKIWYIDLGDEVESPEEFLGRLRGSARVPIDLSINAKRDSKGNVIQRRRSVTAIAQAKIVRWTDDYTAIISFNYHIGSLSGEGWEGKLIYENGIWRLEVDPLSKWRA